MLRVVFLSNLLGIYLSLPKLRVTQKGPWCFFALCKLEWAARIGVSQYLTGMIRSHAEDRKANLQLLKGLTTQLPNNFFGVHIHWQTLDDLHQTESSMVLVLLLTSTEPVMIFPTPPKPIQRPQTTNKTYQNIKMDQNVTSGSNILTFAWEERASSPRHQRLAPSGRPGWGRNNRWWFCTAGRALVHQMGWFNHWKTPTNITC